MGDRLRRLDDNAISRGVSWLFTRVAAPIGVVGGVVMLVIGVVEALTGGHDALGLLIMGAVWLGFGLLFLPPDVRQKLRRSA